jgi:6-phosphogluconolactonase (cycloisomerase 2 family)
MQPMQPHVMIQGGHLYMQTNEVRNFIIHWKRAPDGTLTEVERCSTGGAGSGVYKPISDQESAPNAFEGAASVIITPDHRLLFATNGGDNSVSSFSVGENGRLTLVDVKRTGNVISGRFGELNGRSGTAKSLAYSPSSSTLYVLHSFGPDHLRLMSVDAEGRLTPRPERYTMNTMEKPHRIPTLAVLSPDERFLVVGTTFDEPARANPDGSPILWINGNNGEPRSVASNAPDPDGLGVFRVGADGSLTGPAFYDAGGASPFFPLFLRHKPNHFVVGYAVADGIAMGTIDADGRITMSPVVKIDTSAGVPTELCWLSITPDDRFVFATNFGYSGLCSFTLENGAVTVAKDPASPKVPGDGTFRALNGTVSSGPSDNWISPEGNYLYQIYGNARKLVGYAVQPDGSLNEITSCEIPYNSPEGLAGF